MKVTRDEARNWWEHPTQHRGLDLNNMPDLAYYADGPACLGVQIGFWPGTIVIHLGVKPEGWGKLVPHITKLVAEAAEDLSATRVQAWVYSTNRAVVRLALRCGFTLDGAFDDCVILGKGF